MFDTGQAARVLGNPSASLAALLARTVGFDADKRFQLADWRVRPLTEGMRHYARCDTHFLLHAYDCLRGELAAADAAEGAAVRDAALLLRPRERPAVEALAVRLRAALRQRHRRQARQAQAGEYALHHHLPSPQSSGG